jgi:hypothetical protein
MKKVISFSLWGDNPTYTVGAIRNVELAKNFYPDFECWIYLHKQSVPKEIIQQLNTHFNVKIIYKDGDLTNENCKPRMWRFEAIDDDEVEIMISRDTDTRILMREVIAVNEWINSGKIFHIMRDHPHHDSHILAGMFGARKIKELTSWSKLINNYVKCNNRMYDQDFLRDYIYPLVINNSIVHATFYKKEVHAADFPTKYCSEYKFVGEYVYFDESRSERHINILKSSI